MPDIRHRVVIDAPIHDVYQALATSYPEDMKISSWG
jgi:hypothetical protein